MMLSSDQWPKQAAEMDRKANKHFVNPTAVLRKDYPTTEAQGKVSIWRKAGLDA
jgi:hypothetical protein